MTQAEEHEKLVVEVAKAFCLALMKGGGRPVTPAQIDIVWDYHKGGFANEQWKELARACLAVVAEKAKEWPTEDMSQAMLRRGSLAPHGDWRAMFSRSPLVKPDSDR